MELKQRAQAFFRLSRLTGFEVSSHFLRKTREHFPQAKIEILHNLAEGIFKPANDKYALSIWSRSAAGKDHEIYQDLFFPQADGSWIMEYAAKDGSLDSAINQSLFSCMRDKVPLLVIVTTKPKESLGGARYKLLGPAIIENFNLESRRFLVRGCSLQVVSSITQKDQYAESEELYIRNYLILPFQLKENREKYLVSKEVREQAFRKIILDEYLCLCAVCQSKFILKQEGKEPLVEAEAAHIIPKNAKGPDDPRNGLSLCKRHHWAFDNGLFTVTDVKVVKVSPSVLSAERRRFDLEEYDTVPLIPPVNNICSPNEKALHWHQTKIFRSFLID